MRIAAGILFLFLASLAFSGDADAFGEKKRRPKPSEYGNIVINNYSGKANIAPVVFNHWLHRSKYTCRLCHIDIGFAMKAGDTGITEKDNLAGMYCGACHNGKIAFGPEDSRAAGKSRNGCERCHSVGRKVEFTGDFAEFRKPLPKERFGNEIDWMKAEEQKIIALTDQIEGISIKRNKLKNPDKFEINARIAGMPDIIFSHEKHTVWNGCELCHPDLFGVRKGATEYSMEDIFNGRFCGACHGKVAFPNEDCQRCHSKPVY